MSECEENFDFLGIFGVLNFSVLLSRGGVFTYGVLTTWDTPVFWGFFLSHLTGALRYIFTQSQSHNGQKTVRGDATLHVRSSGQRGRRTAGAVTVRTPLASSPQHHHRVLTNINDSLRASHALCGRHRLPRRRAGPKLDRRSSNAQRVSWESSNCTRQRALHSLRAIGTASLTADRLR